MSRDPFAALDAATEHDVVFRVTVTRRVRGVVTPERRHKYVRALKRLISLVGPTHSLYHVEVCEVAAVREVNHQSEHL